MPKEISKELPLTEQKENMLLMHSFFNVLNTISSQLQILQIELEADHCFSQSLELLKTLKDAYYDLQVAVQSASSLLSFQEVVQRELKQCLQDMSLTPEREQLVRDMEDDLQSVFSVVQVRVREFVQRAQGQGEWLQFHPREIEDNLKQVLTAIAKNSHGRYGIVFDPEEQTADHYLVNLHISSGSRECLTMPGLLQDCLRDLTANARKYTDPGGVIEVQLEQRQDEIFLQVQDNGWGIPEDEVEQAVDFGYRASNVQDKSTRGGGFGLTKAYYVTQKFGGRMWIDSGLGRGTSVSISLPRPVDSGTEPSSLAR